MTSRETMVRESVLDSHRETIAAVIGAGRAVAEAWPVETAAESGTVTKPLEQVLQERKLSGPLLELLETGSVALGKSVQGAPVPAPPYLAVTSRGPVCRGTLSDGQRLVIELVLFAIDRDPVRYRFCDPTPAECLAVHLR